MINWSDAYLKQIEKCGGVQKYICIKTNQKKKLLRIIRENSGQGKIIEAGCGTGIISAKLAHEGYNVTGIDIDTKILKLAGDIEKEYYGQQKTHFEKKSIFELDYKKNEFDLCFSVGVLEHFDDNKIISSLSSQILMAKKTIVVIPTKWFDDIDNLHGDDRFLPLTYWRDLIKKSGGKIIKEASYPFRGKGFSFLNKLKKILRPKAYRIFVIKKNS